MKWFRLYDEALNDPKVQRLPDGAFKCWINLLCLANKGSPRGRINPSDIAYALRISDDKTDKMVTYFLEHGLLDREGDVLVPHCWDERQFTSDNVTERVRKHRGNVSSNVSGNVTKPLRETPPETDTDTDTEQNRITPLSPQGEDGPYALWEAFGLATNQDVGASGTRARGMALKAAKQMVADGFTAEDVAGCAKYLQSQTWRESLITFGTVAKEIGPWRMAGKPDRERNKNGKQLAADDAFALAAELRRQGL